MFRKTLLVAVIIGVAFLAACAPGVNPAAGGEEDAAGFWHGLWHGFIALFTFIISLFSEKVTMYEAVNNGGWYNFGFLLGVMIFWGGSGSGASRGGRCR